MPSRRGMKEPPGLPNNTVSMFGPQANARKKSGPSFGFGAASRYTAGKVFISQEMAQLNATTVSSPGPNTANSLSCPAAVGPQPEKPSAPRWSMGKAERFPKSDPDSVPGPGKYNSASSNGAQVSSRNRSNTGFGFGCSTRDQLEKVSEKAGLHSPGPAAPYRVDGSVGRQSRSTKKGASSPLFGTGDRFNDPSFRRTAALPGPGPADVDAYTRPNHGKFSFGASTRDTMEKVYISAEHEKCTPGGRGAPGPGAYDVKGQTGSEKPTGNRMRTPPSYTWGAAQQRPSARRNDTPGPGQYVV